MPRRSFVSQEHVFEQPSLLPSTHLKPLPHCLTFPKRLGDACCFDGWGMLAAFCLGESGDDASQPDRQARARPPV